MLGINGGEFLVIAVIFMILIGPQRLPEYASQLADWVKKARLYATGAKEQIRTELGPEFDDVDWRQFDPRQYDPRRIVREALTSPLEDGPQPSAEQIPVGGVVDRQRTTPPPFDVDAT